MRSMWLRYHDELLPSMSQATSVLMTLDTWMQRKRVPHMRARYLHRV